MKNLIAGLLVLSLLLTAGCAQSVTPTTTAPPVTLPPTTTVTATQTTTATLSAASTRPTRTPSASVTASTSAPTLTTAPLALEAQTVLNLGLMVHLEGWKDDQDEERFRRHAELLRQYADLFEKYGAKLTLESKEMTPGSILWEDNILREMQERGHCVGVHADVGGSAGESLRLMEARMAEMKTELESLEVVVRHVSGISSRRDWVTAAADSGYSFVTGTVSFALASLPPEMRPLEIPDDAGPAQFHASYPLALEDQLQAWRAENGRNWIEDNPAGRVVIMPSGGGLAYAYEESQGQMGLAGDQQLTAEDIPALEAQLQQILAFMAADASTQPYQYYLSWSFGKALDINLMEQWLQMVDRYVQSGQVRWQTIGSMYDDYLKWEIDSGRR